MKGIKNFVEKFETAMVAAAFAEAGEFETAREIMRESNIKQKRESVQKS